MTVLYLLLVFIALMLASDARIIVVDEPAQSGPLADTMESQVVDLPSASNTAHLQSGPQRISKSSGSTTPYIKHNH